MLKLTNRRKPLKSCSLSFKFFPGYSNFIISIQALNPIDENFNHQAIGKKSMLTIIATQSHRTLAIHTFYVAPDTMEGYQSDTLQLSAIVLEIRTGKT